MIVRELFSSVPWEEAAQAIVNIYPDEMKNLEGYRRVFYEVREMQDVVPDERGFTVSVKWLLPDSDDDTGVERYYDVFGMVPDDETAYALELSSFHKWAGFEVDESSLSEFGAAKLTAAILYEMTFFGYSEEDIEKERQLLRDRAEEAEAMLDSGNYVILDEETLPE